MPSAPARWWLPDMTGAEFLETLHADPTLADVPAVMCTGDSRVEEEVRLRGIRVRGVYLKPLDAEKLLHLLESHCSRSGPPPKKEVA